MKLWLAASGRSGQTLSSTYRTHCHRFEHACPVRRVTVVGPNIKTDRRYSAPYGSPGNCGALILCMSGAMTPSTHLPHPASARPLSPSARKHSDDSTTILQDQPTFPLAQRQEPQLKEILRYLFVDRPLRRFRDRSIDRDVCRWVFERAVKCAQLTPYVAYPIGRAGRN